MQVLAIGFAAPSLAASFGLSIPQAIQAGTAFFLGMLVGAWGFGRLADRIGRRKVLIVTVLIDAVFGLASVFAHDFALLLALAAADRHRRRRDAAGRLRHDGRVPAAAAPRPLAGGAGGLLGRRHHRRGARRLGRQPLGGRPGLALAVRGDGAPRHRRLLAPPLAAGIAALPAACAAGSRRRGRSWTGSPAPTGGPPTAAPLVAVRPPARPAARPARPRAAAAHAADPGRVAPGLDRLLRRVHLAARPAGHARLRLRARLRLPGAARPGAAAGLRAGGRRHRDHRPPPHAGRLPLRQRRRLPAVRPSPSSRPGSPRPCSP